MGTRSGGIFPPDSANTRYVTIKKPTGSLEEHSIFLITKSIEAYCHYDEIRSNRRDGSLTVALQEKQAKKLVEKMKELADHTPVQVSWDERRNQSKAILVCRELVKCQESEIKSELANQGVIDARHIARRDGDQKVNTGVVILTFSNPTPPEKVKIGYRICRTEKYYPRPMQCYRCFEYNHISKFSKNNERCRVCGEKAHNENEECPNETKCANCYGNHYSTSKICNKFREEQQIVRVKIDENILYQAARNKLLNRTGENSYANITNDTKKTIQEARTQWKKEMRSKMKFISERMEELAKKEHELKNFYNYVKQKDTQIDMEIKKLNKESEAMEEHCNSLTNELQKKDDIIKKLTTQIENQERKIASIKEKHAKKSRTDKHHESSPERASSPKRKSNRKNKSNTNSTTKTGNTDTSDMEAETVYDIST